MRPQAGDAERLSRLRPEALPALGISLQRLVEGGAREGPGETTLPVLASGLGHQVMKAKGNVSRGGGVGWSGGLSRGGGGSSGTTGASHFAVTFPGFPGFWQWTHPEPKHTQLVLFLK